MPSPNQFATSPLSEDDIILPDDDPEKHAAEQLWDWFVNLARKKIQFTYHWCLMFLTSFIGAHYIYVLSMAILVSIIFYPVKNMPYTDALFHAVSISTTTGLNTVPLGDMKVYQQVVLYIVPFLMSPVMISCAVVVLRLYFFNKKFDNIAEMSKRLSKMRRAATLARFRARTQTDNSRGRGAGDTSLQRANSKGSAGIAGVDEDPEAAVSPAAIEDRDIRFGELPMPPRRGYNTHDMFRSLNMMQTNPNYVDVDEEDGPPLVIKSPRDIEIDEARGISGVVRTARDPEYDDKDSPGDDNWTRRNSVSRSRRGSESRLMRRNSTARSLASRPGDKARSAHKNKQMASTYLSWTPTVGGNSTFVGLTKAQKDELGGVEYRALRLLLWFVIGLYFSVHLIVVILFVPWTYARDHYREIAEQEKYSPGWYAAFLAMSSFCNLGMSISGQSLTIYQQSAYIPLWVSFFIIMGNTAFPVLLRATLWVAFKLSPPYGRLHETLGFLLDHPRRCFMLLFPATATLWLLFCVCVFHLFDLILFVILDLGKEPLQSIPMNYRVMGGFVQSVCTRIAGFSILPISELHPAVRLAYIILMYISVFPLAVSIRKTNVYEEQTLGIYAVDDGAEDSESDSGSDANSAVSDRKSVVSRDPKRQYNGSLMGYMQRQLSHDLWFLVLGLMLVLICEAGKVERNEINFFDILFEVVSAYGTVGMSVGHPSTSASLASQFNTVGKLVLMGLMIRGRHRGLPYRVDRSIILKGKDVEQLDEVQQMVATNPTLLRQRDFNDDNWFTSVNTAATRLRRVGTTATRLRPSFTSLSANSGRLRFRKRANST